MHAIVRRGVRAGESALKFDIERKIHCLTGKSNLRQRHAGPMLYQLSYIPISSRLPTGILPLQYSPFCSFNPIFFFQITFKREK